MSILSILVKLSNNGPGSPPLTTMANARTCTTSYLPTISSGISPNTSMVLRVMFPGRKSMAGNCLEEISKPSSWKLWGNSCATSSSQQLYTQDVNISIRSGVDVYGIPIACSNVDDLCHEAGQRYQGVDVVAERVLPQPVLEMQSNCKWTFSEGHVHLGTGLTLPMLCSCGSTCTPPERKCPCCPYWWAGICV